MENVSGFGFTVYLNADISFPAGFLLTQFADDADPITSEPMAITDTAMGLNGDLIVWNKAEPIKASISVIPDSEDDLNLQILANNNRAGRGKFPIRDVVTLTKVFPNGRTEVYSNGTITNAPIGTGVASAGRLKTKTYSFAFENKIG